ncbi:MAG: class I SAM-dependent methyltransferase, partial [Nanoarchaeota archaeon]|nr:class I SAM-dependent methyltransferase [Nanoarchaeota archaeon]
MVERMKHYNEMAEVVESSWCNKNYVKEVSFFLKIFKQYGIKPNLIYDVACGSGSHAKLLMDKGYGVIGVDLNDGMIRLAKKKVPKLRIVKQDMRKLNMNKKADCIITMFNAINHFSSYKDFEMMLKSYKNNLSPEGIVIFDTMLEQRNWIDGFHGAKSRKFENKIIAKVDRSYRVSKNKGFTHQVFVVFEGKNKKAKILEGGYENFIYDIDRMKNIIKKVG